MNKLWMTAIFCTLLSACASYTPIVDTKGKARFETSNAEELSNDKILCAKLAKNNSSFLSNIGFWITSPEADTQYTDIYRKCMVGRNHQVLN